MQFRATIVLLAILVGIATADEPDQASPPGWQRLQDVRGRFVVRAPAGWSASRYEKSDKSGVAFVAPPEGPLANGKFQVYAYEDLEVVRKLTLRYWIGMFTKQLEKGGMRPYREPENVTLLGGKGLWLFYRKVLKQEVEGTQRSFEIWYWFLPVRVDERLFLVMTFGAERRFAEGHEALIRRLFEEVRLTPARQSPSGAEAGSKD